MEIIETPRLLLRRLTLNEYNNIFENYARQDAMAFFGFTTEEAFLAEKKKYDGGLKTYRTSVMYFHLIDKLSSKVIGDCAFHNWYPSYSRSEIGYAMRAEEYKNKGYMKEAILPIVYYGFEEMGLNRIEAFISPDNEPSLKLVTRLGFKREGLLREHIFKNNVMEDSLAFGLLKSDFI